MRMRLTEHEFITECKLIYGNKYDFSQLNYKNISSSVNVICDIHGLFSKRASRFIDGSGCNKCNKKPRPKPMLRKTQEQYEIDANKFHDCKYDYSKSKYETNESILTIICPIHGEFNQKAQTHLNRGCRKCGGEKRRLTTDTFVERSSLIHGNKYDYSNSIYIKKRDKVKIGCPIHGNFMQSPTDHLAGSGCSDCGKLLTSWSRSDYKKICENHKNKSKVYLIRLSSNNELFYKVGITVLNVKKRFSKACPYKIECISEIEMDSMDAWDSEKMLIRSVARKKYTPFFRLDGWTECFSEPTTEVLEFFGVQNV